MAPNTPPARLPGPLDANNRAAWRSLAMMVHLVDNALERQVQHDGQISHAHYKILVLLSESPDHTLQLKEVADELQFSPSRVSHAMSRLERIGLARREPTTTIGKSYQAALTPSGLDLVRRVGPLQADTVRRRILGALSPEQIGQLAAISAAIVGSLSDDGEPDL